MKNINAVPSRTNPVSTVPPLPETPPCQFHPLRPPAIRRKATRTYRAKRRNGHYLTPSIGDTPVKRPSKTRGNTGEVQFHKVRRKLQFGRKPPTPRIQEEHSEAEEQSSEREETVQREIPMKTNDENSKQRGASDCSRKIQSQCVSVSRSNRKCKSKFSREILPLVEVSGSAILPRRLRSSRPCTEGLVVRGTDASNTSPERSKGRQN